MFTSAPTRRSTPADRIGFAEQMRLSALNTLLNAMTAAVMTLVARLRSAPDPNPHLTLR